jgi:formyltetrahydrofolate hydrolase
MAKLMHQAVMRAIKVVVQVAHYVVLSFDEVSTINNQSWMSIHYYVV